MQWSARSLAHCTNAKHSLHRMRTPLGSLMAMASASPSYLQWHAAHMVFADCVTKTVMNRNGFRIDAVFEST